MAGVNLVDRIISGLATKRMISAVLALEKSIPAAYRILRTVKRPLLQLLMRPSQTALARLKRDQMTTFCTLRGGFPIIYNKLKQFDITQFTIPFWEDYNVKLEKAFLPYPPFSFLRNPIILHTMFMTAGGKWLKEELTFLEREISRDKLKILLEEDYVGNPLLSNSTYLTSHNSIHHLYHFIRFLVWATIQRGPKVTRVAPRKLI
ncbi:MAG: hypothetical protein MUP49_03245 [Dehalococcoidia bacterium]|nr:hypothetical protein [Dehalococcoidia bacterium]